MTLTTLAISAGVGFAAGFYAGFRIVVWRIRSVLSPADRRVLSRRLG